MRSSHLKERADDDSSSVMSTSQGSDDETGEDEEGEEEGEQGEQGDGDQIVMGSGKREFDARSIRSFESMMSDRQKGRDRSGTGRKSLTDRLARVSGIGSLKVRRLLIHTLLNSRSQQQLLCVCRRARRIHRPLGAHPSYHHLTQADLKAQGHRLP